MTATFNAASKDLRRHLKDPTAFAIWIGLPLMIGLLMSLVAGGGGDDGPPKARVLLIDEDATLVSGFLATAMKQADIFEIETLDPEQARAAIEAGEASALVVVPKGFQSAVLEDRPCVLRMTSNPAQRILPVIVEETLDVLGEGVFFAHRILGDEIREIVTAGAEGEMPEADVARIAVAIDRVVKRVQSHLLPPAFEIETAVIEKDGSEAKGGGPTFAQLVLPGVLILSLLFMAQGISEDIWREKRLGTLTRAAGAPAGLGAIVRGKILAGGVLMAVVALVFLIMGLPFVGLSYSAVPLAVLWSALAGSAFLALMLLIQVHVSSQSAGSVMTNSLVFPLMMLGGSLFPLEAMPAWMASAGRLTPNGHALETLKSMLLGRADAAAVATSFLAAAALLAVVVLVVQRRVSRRFAGR